MKILAISGSLREKSYNTTIINTLASLNTEIEIYKDLDKLPFFNPDLDIHTLKEDSSPVQVKILREKIAEADLLIISTPEYAFEIPGVLKNALDWLVSGSSMVEKSVVVISASTSGMGADKANEVLRNLVKVLTGKDVSLFLTIDRVNKKIDTSGRVTDTILLEELQKISCKKE